jgi:hypothetical protein
MWAKGYWKSLDNYLQLFAEAGDATVIMEASNAYTQSPMQSGVPERILSFNPDARFIYIMRDPVERTISHYWHMVRWSGEYRSLLAAVSRDPQYIETSHYARQLQAYLQCVASERVYAFTLESLVADPLTQMSQLYAWLGLDSSFRPSSGGVDTNTRPEVFEGPRGYGWLDRIRRAPSYRKFVPVIPRALRRFGRRLAVRTVSDADIPLAEVKSYLRPRQREQTEELGKLLNRSFPEWTTLYGAS